MAIWTVNTNADDGSVDTTNRVGSLRGIIGASASGDTIIFDNTTFPDGVETSIYFSRTIEIQKSLTIDGGETWTSGGELKTRVVLDLQEGVYRAFGFQQDNNYTYTLNALTFYNGCNTTGGAIYSRYGELTINNCVFDTFNCSAGGGIANGGAITIVNNCVFKNCNASQYGGALYLSVGTLVLNACDISNCTANQGGASVYLRDASFCTINKCNIGTTTSTTNIYNNSTVGTLGFQGITAVDKFQVDNGATVVFSGVDAVLAVTTTATIGAATFTAAEGATGYAAFPKNTDISAATFTGVKTAIYGSVTSINATIDANVATFTIQAESTGYLIEGSTDGVTWETITPTDGKATLTSAKAYQFRAFAGAFVYSPVIPRTYYYTGGTADGDFSVAADWALDKEKTIVCSDAPTIKDGVFYCVEVE